MNYETLYRENNCKTGMTFPGLGDTMLSVEEKTLRSFFHHETKLYINLSQTKLKQSVGAKTADRRAQSDENVCVRL